MPITVKRLRTPSELALAADMLRRNGYTECFSCHAYSTEEQRIDANPEGAHGDTRCAYCGANWTLMARMDAAS